MSVDRWSSEPEPEVLGIVAHGPAVVARSPGIAMAVRCVFAHPGGLEIEFVLRASGVQAEAAARQTFGGHAGASGLVDPADDTWPSGSEPVLLIEVDGRRAIAYPYEQSHSGGDDHFAGDARVTADLPSDGQITVTASWPQAGLAEGSVVLTLASLDDLDQRVIHLPS